MVRLQWPPRFGRYWKFGIGLDFGKWTRITYCGIFRVEKSGYTARDLTAST